MRVFVLLASVFFASLVTAACAAPVDDEDVGESSQEIARSVMPNLLANDADIEGHQDVTVAQVQAFLEQKGSALANYSEGGETAASLIVARSRAEKVSPIYMLARIETESGLVRSGTLANLRSATGCGCPDGVPCNPALATFALQVRCAAELLRGYLRSLDTAGTTISGWRVGVGKSTLDGCWVTPKSRATAAFYTYTPWVGAYGIGCGTTRWGGSTLVAVLLRQFAKDFGVASTMTCSYGDGLYCGGNGTPGDPAVLYRCRGGATTVAQACESGCQRMQAGVNDRCR
jgi:hypothetical protein